MPRPIWLAHKLASDLYKTQKVLPYLAPDGKTQVGIEYRNRKPYRIHSIGVIASQNSPSTPDLKQFQDDIRETVINSVFQDEDSTRWKQVLSLIPVVIGGPSVHSG